MPRSVKKMMTANEKKAMKALALMSGCLFWKIFTSNSPPMMNMKAVSGVCMCMCVCVRESLRHELYIQVHSHGLKELLTYQTESWHWLGKYGKKHS